MQKKIKVKEGSTQQRILDVATILFSEQGVDSVSMRDIAEACQIKAPSLYNHFKDKQTLYCCVLEYVFKKPGSALVLCLAQPIQAEEKLKKFIVLACQQMEREVAFRQLFIRELLVQDADRSRFLAEEVMAESCLALHQVFKDINPKCDPHFLTTTLMGLLFFHFQSNALRPYLPGGGEETQSLDYLSKNIIKLMLGFLELK